MTQGDDHWVRKALLANMRQELMAPVSAILGYAEMLRDEAATGNVADVADDLDRIHSAAGLLSDLSERLLDPTHSAELLASADLSEAQSRIRHDLRNPLSAIKGYGEMLMEDAADLGCQALAPDLGCLLDEVNRLLAQLESIVDFSRGGKERATAAAASMVAQLEGLIRPEARQRERKALPGHVLVVDDNGSNRDLLARRLVREGHRADTAEDGHRALEMAAATPYDLILLDLMMPGISGYEVLLRLKGRPQTAQVPVIMISALTEMDSIVRCIEAGADDYLPKPVDNTLLTARIGASLERKQANDRERRYLLQIEEERRKSEALLLNILPPGIVERMHAGEGRIADRFDDVTILFADLVGFTPLSARIAAHKLVDSLNRLFSGFDAASTGLGVEKIKTIGDAYMAAAGLPEPRPDHAEACIRLALAMLDCVEEFNRDKDHELAVRIGLHSGPVIAGIIGVHKFVYDVWGNTVNVASRMESYGSPGRIHMSAETAARLGGRFPLEARGILTIRGMGEMETFFLAQPPQGGEKRPCP